MRKIIWTSFAISAIWLTVAFSNRTELKVETTEATVTYKNTPYRVYTANADAIKMKWKGNDNKPLLHFSALEKELGTPLVFATNGGMFDKNSAPVGLYIENGKQLKQLNTTEKGYGNFLLQPNGVFAVTANGAVVNTTKNYATNPPTEVSFATQSGPMLVIDGKLHPAFKNGSTNVHIRSGVGVNNKGEVVFAISNERVNLYDFASLFRDKLNCKNALYLDGFVSKMHLPERPDLNANTKFGVIIYTTE